MSNKDATLRATFTAVDKVSKPLSAMNKNIAGVRKAMSGVGAAGSRLGSAMLPFAAVGAGVAAFAAKSVKGFLDTSGSLQDMSDRLGISAEKLQEWSYVAEKSGVDSESMQGSMEKLNKAIFSAGSGKGDAVKLFKKLGISVRDANGKLKTSADLMPEIADAFKKNENPTLRTAMAMTLMGKSGASMIGVLSQGSAAIKEQQDEARRLGLVLSDADIAAGDAFSDEQLGKFNKQLQAIGMTVGAKLIPVLAPLVQQMSDWLSANRVQIADGIARAATALGNALKNIDWERVGFWMKAIFGGVVVAQIAGVVAAVAGFASSIATLGVVTGVALGLPLLAIGLLAAAAFMLWKNWDGVVGGLKALWENFGNWIGPKIDSIMQKFAGVKQFFSGVAGMFGGGDSAATTGSGRGRGAVSLNAGNKQNVQGEMVVRFEGAPPGMRVDQGKTNAPGFSLNPDVGYRSQAWGAT